METSKPDIHEFLAQLQARTFRFDTTLPSSLPPDLRSYLRAIKAETEAEINRQRRDFDVLFAIVNEVLFPETVDAKPEGER